MSELTKLQSRLKEKSKLQKAQQQIMKLFILSSSIIFITLIAVWWIQLQPESEIPRIYIWSTFFIFMSSIGAHLGKRAIMQNELEKAAHYIISTIFIGIIFAITQLIGWNNLIEAQKTYKSILLPFAMIHFTHIVVGIILLAIVWWRIKDFRVHSRQMSFSSNTFYFWHFLGLIWIIFISILA